MFLKNIFLLLVVSSFIVACNQTHFKAGQSNRIFSEQSVFAASSNPLYIGKCKRIKINKRKYSTSPYTCPGRFNNPSIFQSAFPDQEFNCVNYGPSASSWPWMPKGHLTICSPDIFCYEGPGELQERYGIDIYCGTFHIGYNGIPANKYSAAAMNKEAGKLGGGNCHQLDYWNYGDYDHGCYYDSSSTIEMRLSFNDQEYTYQGGRTHTLRLRDKAQKDLGIDTNKYYIHQVVAKIKSRDGKGIVNLQVGNKLSENQFAPGTGDIADFNSSLDTTFGEIDFFNPSEDRTRNPSWQLKLRGNLKVREVTLIVREKY